MIISGIALKEGSKTSLEYESTSSDFQLPPSPKFEGLFFLSLASWERGPERAACFRGK